MTRIYLIRHAEAEGNLYRLSHGQYNSTVTPRGYRQLAALRRRFRDIPIDAVYGSDLTRAHATASALYVPRNLPFQPLPLLREVRLGDWEERTWAEIKRRTPEMYSWFNKRPDLWHVEGAETFPTVAARTVEGIRRIAAEKNASSEGHRDMVRFDYILKFGYYCTESSEHNAEYNPFYIKSKYPELIERYHIPLDEYPRRCVNQIEKWKTQKEEILNI